MPSNGEDFDFLQDYNTSRNVGGEAGGAANNLRFMGMLRNYGSEAHCSSREQQ